MSDAGRIAVVGQINGSLSLPKGHVEPGETELEAAVREISEEVGLVVEEPVKRYPAYVRQSGRRPDELKQIVMFLFTVGGEPELRSMDPSNTNARWLAPDEAVEKLTYLEDRKFLVTALANLNAGS